MKRIAQTALLASLAAAADGCACPDGSPLAPSFPPCTGGRPVGDDCQGPPAGGGGAPPGGAPTGGGTAPGGGGAAGCAQSPCAAGLLGDVGATVASGTDARSGRSFYPSENIYGPFEAGFTSQQVRRVPRFVCFVWR